MFSLHARCRAFTSCGIVVQADHQVWITTGDIILLSLREFQDDKADVIHRYTPDEARNLKTYGELKSDFTINEAADGDAGSSDEEGGIDFEEAEIDDLCELHKSDPTDQQRVHCSLASLHSVPHLRILSAAKRSAYVFVVALSRGRELQVHAFSVSSLSDVYGPGRVSFSEISPSRP